VNDEKYGPVGSRIILENDLVRVWEVQLAAGERLSMHHHTLPYLIIPLEVAHNRLISIDGTAQDIEEVVGQIVFREAGQIHELHNVGTTHYRNLLVEIKK